MLKFKINTIEELKKKGVTNTSARESRILSQSTFTAMKNGMVPTGSLDRICEILKMQPGDIIEWVPDKEEE